MKTSHISASFSFRTKKNDIDYFSVDDPCSLYELNLFLIFRYFDFNEFDFITLRRCKNTSHRERIHLN